jgi:hypothetical protein
MINPRQHNYYRKRMQLYQEGKVPPGRLSEVDIYRDDGCRIYQGGYCNCDPEIKLRPPPELN